MNVAGPLTSGRTGVEDYLRLLTGSLRDLHDVHITAARTTAVKIHNRGRLVVVRKCGSKCGAGSMAPNVSQKVEVAAGGLMLI